MSDIERIGFIGMGNMGVPMAANLVRAGYAVTALRHRGRTRRSISRKTHNARATESLAALGQSCRPRHHHAAERPRGARTRCWKRRTARSPGILRAGAAVIDMSSADPVGTRPLGAELAARRIELVDAPVSGGVPRAKDGTLAIMIGGNAGRRAGGEAGAVEDGRQAVRGRRARLRPRHEGAQQFSRRDVVCGGERSGARRADVRARPGGDDRRDQRVDRAELSDRPGDEAARAERNLRDRLCARAFWPRTSGSPPISRRRSAPMRRSCGLISDLWAEARDAIGPAQDHSRAAEYWDRK